MTAARPRRGTLSLRLYVAGNAPNSRLAIANARALCEAHFNAHYELEIVDMMLEPQRALDDAIVVTPTLLKLRPLPRVRVIGNLSDTKRVLLALAET